MKRWLLGRGRCRESDSERLENARFVCPTRSGRLTAHFQELSGLGTQLAVAKFFHAKRRLRLWARDD